MRTGYRWLDAAGEPVSPFHRSPATAARWLGRQARRHPARLLVNERRSPVRPRPYRTPLKLAEAEALMLALGPLSATPHEPRSWLLRTGQRVEGRVRRRRATGALTRSLRSAS